MQHQDAQRMQYLIYIGLNVNNAKSKLKKFNIDIELNINNATSRLPVSTLHGTLRILSTILP